MIAAAKISQSSSQRQVARLYGQLKLSSLMQLGQEAFAEYIRQIEDDPLFKDLVYPSIKDGPKAKIVGFNRFPKTEIAGPLFDLEEGLLKDTKVPDVESLLASKKEIVRIVKRIGADNFKKYFLYGDHDLSIDEVSAQCGVGAEEVERIFGLVDELAVKNRFYTADSAVPSAVKHSKVASIYKKDRDFVIGFFDLHLARGKYTINHARLKQLKDQGRLSKQRLRQIQSLLNRLEFINLRKSTLFRILDLVIKKQKEYLGSGDLKNRIPLPQNQAASLLDISPGLLSRALALKSIEAPWGEELGLKHFFPSLKEARLQALKELLEAEEGARSDDDIRTKLADKYGIFVSRRTISKYRKELGIKPFTKS